GATCGIDADAEATGRGLECVPITRCCAGFAIGFSHGQVANRRDFAEQHQRVAILEIHGREFAAFVRERFARAARDPRDLAAFPGARVEYQAASTGPRRAAQSGESIAEIVVCGGGAGFDESLLVCPLRDGLASTPGAPTSASPIPRFAKPSRSGH